MFEKPHTHVAKVYFLLEVPVVAIQYQTAKGDWQSIDYVEESHIAIADAIKHLPEEYKKYDLFIFSPKRKLRVPVSEVVSQRP